MSLCCSVHYSWTRDDVIEVKGPLPHEFSLSADVTVKPEVFAHFYIVAVTVAVSLHGCVYEYCRGSLNSFHITRTTMQNTTRNISTCKIVHCCQLRLIFLHAFSILSIKWESEVCSEKTCSVFCSLIFIICAPWRVRLHVALMRSHSRSPSTSVKLLWQENTHLSGLYKSSGESSLPPFLPHSLHPSIPPSLKVVCVPACQQAYSYMGGEGKREEGGRERRTRARAAGVYCTQCEAEGFRRITPFQDRPDVMARRARLPGWDGARASAARSSDKTSCGCIMLC